jgi:hypothetical protein
MFAIRHTSEIDQTVVEGVEAALAMPSGRLVLATIVCPHGDGILEDTLRDMQGVSQSIGTSDRAVTIPVDVTSMSSASSTNAWCQLAIGDALSRPPVSDVSSSGFPSGSSTIAAYGPLVW